MKRFVFLALTVSLTVMPAGAVKTKLRVELQVNICEKIDSAVEKLDLAEEDVRDRETFLFETPSMDYIDAHMTLRLRVEGGKGELAVKRSGLDRATMEAMVEDGADCEFDYHGEELTGACKVTKDLTHSELKHVLDRTRGLNTVVSSSQAEMIASAGMQSKISQVKLLGPIKDHIWKIKNPKFDSKISLEMAELPSGRAFVEISTRTEYEDFRSYNWDFQKYLKKKDINVCVDQSGQRRLKLRELLARP